MLFLRAVRRPVRARRSCRNEVKMPIRNPRDFWSGVLFTLLGVGALAIGSQYTLGTAARMGPGYFPRILGILLIVLGVAIALRALRVRGEAMPRFRVRPLVVVLGSVVLFGAIVRPLPSRLHMPISPRSSSSGSSVITGSPCRLKMRKDAQSSGAGRLANAMSGSPWGP